MRALFLTLVLVTQLLPAECSDGGAVAQWQSSALSARRLPVQVRSASDFTKTKERHFLAVYTMPGDTPGQQAELWGKFKADIYVESNDLRDFPAFLQVVKERAGNRQIDLDIDLHGNDDGLALHRSGNTEDTECSVGFLCNEIDKYLNPKQVTVLLEACYSGRAYANTITNNGPYGKYYQNHPSQPKYPIYGIGSHTVNMGNLIFLQYRSGMRTFFVDIRQFDTEPLGAKVEDFENSPTSVWMFFLMLALWESTS